MSALARILQWQNSRTDWRNWISWTRPRGKAASSMPGC